MWRKMSATKRIPALKWKIVKKIQGVANKIIMWHILPDITDEMTKKWVARNSEHIPATISKKIKFGSGQQAIITHETSRAKQIKLVDKSTDILKLKVEMNAKDGSHKY